MEGVSLLKILIIEIIYGRGITRGKIFTQIMLPILKSPTNLPLTYIISYSYRHRK
jgi:hypothetical protein